MLAQNNKTFQFSEVIEALSDQYLKAKTLNMQTKAALNTNAEDKITSIITLDSVCASNLKSSTDTNRKNNSNSTAAAATLRVNKNLTPKVRKEILSTKPCCHYRNPLTKKICGSSFALEVEHTQPIWAEGSHHSENLTVLCSQHNKLKYRQQAQTRFL